jgi:hypothetical protein
MDYIEFTNEELHEFIVDVLQAWQRDRDELVHQRRQANFLQQQLDEKIND